MSKARLVLTALFVDRQTPAEVARRYGVHRSWVYKLRARYRAEGEAALWPRPRRPKLSPAATPASTIELIIRLRKELAESGLDAGPDTICWHLAHHHGVTVSPATVARCLTRAGLVVAAPKKRPRSSYIRFAADLPNECWQSDVTHYWLADGTDAEILSWLDDHARYALSVTAHRRVTGPIVADTFAETAAQHGIPASTLTDNAMVYTTRYSGGRGGRNAFEAQLRRLGVVQKNSRPNHPTTCGKAERFQQTMKKWLAAQPVQPTTIGQLQILLDAFADAYNHRRPHRSLPQRATPATAYAARPKATPAASRDADTHDRVRRDRIDTTGVVTLRHAGRLHHIGIGRTHARTHVLLLVQDLDIRVVNAATGELLRELTLDPTRDYQPTGRPPGPTRK
ncbi:MAG TPA: IS481 family transposase [Actinophytocola sp.]|jgi:transposase InsO family protein|uniref:IS481 family transposase n=1 Tax=Actinophytocola sp. TaxID=1872138 RepID=UPI002DF98375|nr:IS481 family transposase [Actinophytocola sp.]